MSVFENLSRQQPKQTKTDIGALYQQFRANPVEFLVRSGLKIPQNVTDPLQLVQYIAQTRQVPMQYQNEITNMLTRR